MDIQNQLAEEKILQKAYQLKKKSKWLYFIGACLVVGSITFVSIKNYYDRQEIKAHNAMFQAVYYFEQENWSKALHGDDIYIGFLDLIIKFPNTKASNLAHFYLGNIYLHQQQHDKALVHLLKFKTKDKLLHPRTLSLIADIYCDKEKYPQAIKYYQKATTLYTNTTLNAQYTFKLALAYEANKQYEAAIKIFKQIIQKYPSSMYFHEAKKHKSRLKTYIVKMNTGCCPKMSRDANG